MSCLNLKLFPPTKAWSIFTKKLQLRLNKPNLIKKPKTQNSSKKTCKKHSWPISLSIHPKKFKINKRSKTGKNRLCCIQKREHLPVFVHQLFVEHADPVLNPEACEEKIYHHLNTSRAVDCEKNRAFGLQKNGVEEIDETMSTADDMWESLVMASSQMERIDERAEEFIAKFRAEMQNQEKMARYL